MFKNDRKYGRMVTDIQIYLEKHPELYINPNEKDNVRKGNNKWNFRVSSYMYLNTFTKDSFLDIVCCRVSRRINVVSVYLSSANITMTQQFLSLLKSGAI